MRIISFVFLVLVTWFGQPADGQRNREGRQERRRRKRLAKSPEAKIKKLQTLTSKWCSTFLSKEDHKTKCNDKFKKYMEKMVANYEKCGTNPDVEEPTQSRRRRNDDYENDDVSILIELENWFNLLEAGLLPLDQTDEITASLISVRGIKPDTPLSKAPGIFTKLLKATKFFISDHLAQCKKFNKMNRRIAGLVPRFVEKLKLE